MNNEEKSAPLERKIIKCGNLSKKVRKQLIVILGAWMYDRYKLLRDISLYLNEIGLHLFFGTIRTAKMVSIVSNF